MTKKTKTYVFGGLVVVGIAAIVYHFYKKNEEKSGVSGSGTTSGTHSNQSQIPPKPLKPCSGGWELYREWLTGKYKWRCKSGLGEL